MATLKYGSQAEMRADFEKAAKQAGLGVDVRNYAAGFSGSASAYHMALKAPNISAESLANGVDVSIVRLVLPKPKTGLAPIPASGFYIVNAKINSKSRSGTARLRNLKGQASGEYPLIRESGSGKGPIASPNFHTSCHVLQCAIKVDLHFASAGTLWIEWVYCT